MRALIADDSRITRGLLAQILTDCGYASIEQAPDGAEALRLLQERSADLVVTDWRMPRMDGLALVRAAREDPRTREVPIVVISSVSEDELVAQALDAGARSFIRKPFTPANVRRVIAEVQRVEALRRNGAASPAITGALNAVGALELVQFLNLTRRTGTLVLDGDVRGHVEVEDGQVTTARSSEHEGEAAFFDLVQSNEGTFRFEARATKGTPNVARPTTALLLDALRRADERARDAGRGGA